MCAADNSSADIFIDIKNSIDNSIDIIEDMVLAKKIKK